MPSALSDFVFGLGVATARAQARAFTSQGCAVCAARPIQVCAICETRLIRVEGGYRCPVCCAVAGRCLFCNAYLGRAITVVELKHGPMCHECAKPVEER